MAFYLLDTDILSLYQRRQPSVPSALSLHAQDQIAVTAISIEEQFGGWTSLARNAKSPLAREQASRFLCDLLLSWRNFPIVPMTIDAENRFADLVQAKLNVGRFDLKIAAIVLDHKATLVTRNRRDFARVPGLKFEDWSC